MPPSASSSLSMALGRTSDGPTAPDLMSAAATPLLRSSDVPTEFEAISDLPTALDLICPLPTLSVGSVAAA